MALYKFLLNASDKMIVTGKGGGNGPHCEAHCHSCLPSQSKNCVTTYNKMWMQCAARDLNAIN